MTMNRSGPSIESDGQVGKILNLAFGRLEQTIIYKENRTRLWIAELAHADMIYLKMGVHCLKPKNQS